MEKDLIIEKLKAENQRLKEETIELRRENSLLKEYKYENEALIKECESLTKRIEELE